MAGLQSHAIPLLPAGSRVYGPDAFTVGADQTLQAYDSRWVSIGSSNLEILAANDFVQQTTNNSETRYYWNGLRMRNQRISFDVSIWDGSQQQVRVEMRGHYVGAQWRAYRFMFYRAGGNGAQQIGITKQGAIGSSNISLGDYWPGALTTFFPWNAWWRFTAECVDIGPHTYIIGRYQSSTAYRTIIVRDNIGTPYREGYVGIGSYTDIGSMVFAPKIDNLRIDALPPVLVPAARPLIYDVRGQRKWIER